MKQHENGKETHYSFVGNIDCNLSAASCALITVEGKRRLKLQHTYVFCDASERQMVMYRLNPTQSEGSVGTL
jgi:hypothetical protein